MAPTVPIEFAGQKESRKCSLSQIMGKSRKYSKGYATGFVPDFRHAVETMGESEGLGSSGRVDNELTMSEGSCAPKRKSLTSNVDGYESFDVPFQLLSLRKMTRSGRKDLKLRLKSELEEVRKLQKKIASMNSTTTELSPYSDIRSCSEGQKRPPLESQHSTLESSALHGKKRPPPKRNGPKTKRSISGRFESVKSAAPVTPSYAALMKQCESLLNRVISHQCGRFFDKPVDIVKWNIPDYFTIIKHPMDLGTVKAKLISGEYSSLMDFAADVRLTFSNAMTYNPPGNDVHVMAETLSKYFETRWKPIEKKILAIDEVPSEPSRPITCVETEIADQIPPVKKKKITPNDTNVKPEPIKRIMADEEKQKLSMELEASLAELPENIIDFLKEQSYNAGQTNDDEIEIDIDALCDDTLFKLRKLLDDFMPEKQKSQAKAGPCEIEPANESGFSNLSVQPCKVEEDVDIVGGNDPPVSSYPPVEIENGGINKTSKHSSSSSSSSESDSSSSDSDSESDSDSDIAKASEPFNPKKEKVGSGLSLDQKEGDLDNSETGIGEYRNSVDAVGHVEQSSQTNSVSDEPENRQEGENAPSKKQVSPEKLYRAALLRNRFADTILKAQEKALEKGDKRDPEKLRMEREELERRQKEEKARLQAEAKAAEEVRKKAEAEAAAEAKRKRELEREAARQALQKMEKTVDINESSQFLEDLEMLSGVQDEHLPNFTEERSPDHPENGLGSFKLQGSCNPLEQLGLYMKADDEDEEEEPPQSITGKTNDVEEGEID
ncbi:Transcription factor GTE10, partial [Mucuna pruriens]